MQIQQHKNKLMQILFFCPRWGQSHLSWEEFAAKVKDAGYDGVETDIPESEAEKEKLLEAFAKNNLLLIAQHWETVDADFDVHKSVYAERLERLASVKPLFINSQTGKDFFSAKQNDELISVGDSISGSTGVPIFHETHRGKFSFAAHITKDFLQRLPHLQLTLDISHWIAVAETFLENQQEAVDIALSRTSHIHARVGYIEGPQVPDPRVPYWQDALQQHLCFWDKAVNINRKNEHSMLTFTTEFGPPPYMPLDPSTGKAVADQWEVNVFMMELLKKRYN
jgi:sugar phosphate isomerase/epimerase